MSTMIARIHGVLESVERSAALVNISGATSGAGLTYEVLLPAYTAARLAASVGQSITLHTLHFIEGQSQGTTMIPRLAGFTSLEDRRFYELFTTCKGIGNRRALRAMALSTAQIAAAIADRDVALLQSLPEIGRRTAETIVATLRGKVDAFVTAAAYTDAAAGPAGQPAAPSPRTAMARQALEVLMQLGENRLEAVTWIDRALDDEEDRPTSAEALVTKVYQIKAGA